MKNPCSYHWLAVLLLSASSDAAQIARESFDYAAASPLTSSTGGSGWLDAWSQDGESVVTTAAGLGFTDSQGNVLNKAGLAVNTAGTATTRSLRDLSSGPLNNVWISFLYQLPASNSKFEGVSFYRGTQGAFSISNPGNTTTAAIYLTSNLSGGAAVNTGSGTFGQTFFIALKLTKGGGTSGTDRVEAFVNPLLSADPSSPSATINGASFDFDRVRIAGQDGSPLLVDELRIGDTFADVAPHTTAGDPDSDNDGLTNSQEAALGLNPSVSDATLITGIQTHPDWFGLYTASGMLQLGKGGVVLAKNSNDPVNLIFEVQQSDALTQWGTLETFNRQVMLPSGKNFLRVTIGDQ